MSEHLKGVEVDFSKAFQSLQGDNNWIMVPYSNLETSSSQNKVLLEYKCL